MDLFCFSSLILILTRKFYEQKIVFACWVANKELPKHFIEDFNVSLKRGISSVPTVVNEIDTSLTSKEVLNDYLTNKIVYQLDEDMREGLSSFLSYLNGISSEN